MQNNAWENTQLNRKHSKSSDSGFSLVELLIAVTILAIIVIPLLHMFVTSTKINVKSRQTLRATTVAQDIMEGLKAYTLEEVKTQFEPPEGTGVSAYHYPQDGFYIVNSSLIQGGVRELTELEHEGEEIYYFGIQNIKIQGGEYDALIELDASTYGNKAKNKQSNPGAGIAAHDNEFNGKFYAEIGSVAEVSGSSDEASKATDSSYHQDKALDEGVLKDIKQQIEANILNSGGAVPDELDELKLENVLKKRYILVTIEDAGSKDAEGNEQCSAAINFIYEYEYSGMENECTKPDCPYKKGTPGHTNPHSHGDAGSMSGEVYNIRRTFSSGNFYLFYYPIYSSSEIDNIQFRIEDADKLLNEEQPLLKSVILAKQIRSDVDASANVIAPELSDAELLAKENSYRAVVDISADASPANDLIFRTNIDMNMVKNVSDGKRAMIGGVRYLFDSNVMSRLKQSSFSGDEVSEKVTNVIYDVKISVYKTGAAEHFTENNFEDNEEVHKLATITNWD